MDTHRGCCQAGQRTVVKARGEGEDGYTHRGHCQAGQRIVVKARRAGGGGGYS